MNHIILNFINEKKKSQFLFEEKKDGSFVQNIDS
jgi:hypothetical protein